MSLSWGNVCSGSSARMFSNGGMKGQQISPFHNKERQGLRRCWGPHRRMSGRLPKAAAVAPRELSEHRSSIREGSELQNLASMLMPSVLIPTAEWCSAQPLCTAPRPAGQHRTRLLCAMIGIHRSANALWVSSVIFVFFRCAGSIMLIASLSTCYFKVSINWFLTVITIMVCYTD